MKIYFLYPFPYLPGDECHIKFMSPESIRKDVACALLKQIGEKFFTDSNWSVIEYDPLTTDVTYISDFFSN